MDRIERLQRRSAQDERVIALAGGLPSPDTFPRGQLARAFSQTLTGDAALQYGWPEGRDGLRLWIAERLRRRGARVSADDVIVTSGAQQALAIAAQVLCRRGDRVGVEHFSYPAALDLFRTRELTLVPSERVLAGRAKARALYAMPAIGNPGGMAASAEERARLLECARRGVQVLEDDAYAEVHFGRVPAPLLATTRENVWHIGTFSKTLCPGFRVGWLVPPPDQRVAALKVKGVQDLHANSLAQAVLENYLDQDQYEKRLGRLKTFYGRRAERLVRALRRELPSFRFEEPLGGFSVWAEADAPADEAKLLALAVRRGTSFDPGSGFAAFPADKSEHDPLRLRLAFSTIAIDAIDEAVRRLARSYAEYQRASRTSAAPVAHPVKGRGSRSATRPPRSARSSGPAPRAAKPPSRRRRAPE